MKTPCIVLTFCTTPIFQMGGNVTAQIGQRMALENHRWTWWFCTYSKESWERQNTFCHISRENVHIKFPITYGFLLGTQECSSPLQPHSLCLGNTHPVSWALHFMGIRKYSISARMLYVVIREMASWLPPMNVSTVTLISVNLPWFGEIYVNQTEAFTLKCQLSYNKYLLSWEPSMQHRPAWTWTNKPLLYLWNENVSSIYFLGLVCDTG